MRRHRLRKAEILVDIAIDGELVLMGVNLVTEGLERFDVEASGGPGDLRARATALAKATPAWKAREAARVAAIRPISFGIGGVLP